MYAHDVSDFKCYYIVIMFTGSNVDAFTVASSPGLLRVEEGDNVTAMWTLEGVDQRFPLIVKSQWGKEIIEYVFRNPTVKGSTNTYKFVGNGTNTFGFSLENVQLSHAGDYSIRQTVSNDTMRLVVIGTKNRISGENLASTVKPL